MDRQPGRELPKEFRAIVQELVTNQQWRYRWEGGRHPMLFPADLAKPPLAVPTTPGDVRAIRNFITDVRKRGGIWPPKE